MDAFTKYKGQVQRTLKDCGWSNRGIFKAFVAFKVKDAFDAGEAADAFAMRVDAMAPVGMAA